MVSTNQFVLQQSNGLKSRTSQCGFTLLELIMVVAILVLVAALSIPAVSRSFTSQRLNKAADQVRTQMNRARIQSMKTGEVHAFFYELGGETFRMAEFNEQIQNIIDGGSSRREQVPQSNVNFGRDRLPRDVRFVGHSVSEDARASQTMSEVSADTGQLLPILFYPDGSSQDATLYLQNVKGDTLSVNLRGLTGAASVRPVEGGSGSSGSSGGSGRR